ncbi:MAG: sulfite exporter TauE/SafE family protein [Sinimarinibacterium sp.]|jgi:hypothetical protein
MTLSMLTLALIVLFAYTTQALSGFGSTIITVTLAALWLPIPWIMPIVVALNVPFSGWLVWQERRVIDWPLLRREVLPLMIVGTVAGALLAPLLAHTMLRPAYGVLIVALSLFDLWRLQRRHHARFAAPVRTVMVLGSGFTQGMYASGGPLLAAAMGGSGLSKSALRATLLTVWLLLNTGLTLWFVATRRFDADMVVGAAWLFPLTVLGLWMGNHLHHRVNERQHRFVVDIVLLFAGLALLR